MPVIAKFKVNSITSRASTKRDEHDNVIPCESKSIELFPVTFGSEENKRFYSATPSGKIALEVLSEDAANTFEVGAEYYVEFRKAE